MLVLILIVIGFNRAAKSRGLNQILWPSIAFATYFIAPFIAGFAAGIFNPDILNDRGALMFLAYVSIAVGEVIVFAIMMHLYNSRNRLKNAIQSDENLIDDGGNNNLSSNSNANMSDDLE